MRDNRGSAQKSALAVLASCALCLATTGCPGGGGGSSSGGGGGFAFNEISGSPPAAVACPATPSQGTVSVSGSNVISVQIGGNAYCGLNMPCASVKICEPGSTTNCQTITNLLVDTGSFGLRIFSSAITSFSPSLLTPVTAAGSPLAECAEFGSANTWGPIVGADVYLGTEPVISSMPMQLIQSNYKTIPSSSPCATSAASAPGNSDSPFNGILGVGLQVYDDYGLYYKCSSSTCSSPGYDPSVSSEVINPVSALGPTGDSNGVILDMPSIGNDQQNGATGALILGIGTGSHGGNNTASGVKTYVPSTNGFITTTFNGENLSESFLDSGSNLLYFPGTGLSECTDSFICLTQTQCYNAVVAGYSGSAAAQSITFKILADYAVSGSSSAIDAVGADSIAAGMSDTFDWGMPFFYGRKVYVGIDGASTPLGTGPLWAF